MHRANFTTSTSNVHYLHFKPIDSTDSEMQAVSVKAPAPPGLHNPKSRAPVLYIPDWLSQVPSKELSCSAKVVYGRLAQWSQADGTAHRSARQIGLEAGIPLRTVERAIMELKRKGLIGVHQPISGGHNHFVFYHHSWIDRPIVKELHYRKAQVEKPSPASVAAPPASVVVPPANMAVPPANMAVHKLELNKTKHEYKNKDKSKEQEDAISASKQKPDSGSLNVGSCTKIVEEPMVGSPIPKNKESPLMAEYRDTLFAPDEVVTTKKVGPTPLATQDMININPHNIPHEMIRDWLVVRKSKKMAVTATAWNRLNSQLSKCDDPIEAFEIMVSHGWGFLNASWIDKVRGSMPKKSPTHDELTSTDWVNRINDKKR